MPMITRYTLGRDHKNCVGYPEIVEHPEGEYVRHADYIQELAVASAETEFWRLRAKRERERNENTIT